MRIIPLNHEADLGVRPTPRRHGARGSVGLLRSRQIAEFFSGLADLVGSWRSKSSISFPSPRGSAHATSGLPRGAGVACCCARHLGSVDGRLP